ncbi:hypothetical protein pb186bvf_009799 [Paramecium bursaria]
MYHFIHLLHNLSVKKALFNYFMIIRQEYNEKNDHIQNVIILK